MLTPGVNRPVHDKEAQARLSGRAGNKQRCEKAGSESSPAREARRKLSVARVTRCTTICGGHESISRCDVTRQRKTRWMVKAGQDSGSVYSLMLEASSYAEPDHKSGPTCGFVASPEVGPGATVGTL